MKELKILLSDLFADRAWRNYFFIFLMVPIASWLVFHFPKKMAEEETTPSALSSEKTMDTLIPEGHSLFPLELANMNSLNSFLGAFAKVDVYTSSTETTLKSQLILENASLIRSEIAPEQVALVVPQGLIKHLMKYSPPFSVVLQQDKALWSLPAKVPQGSAQARPEPIEYYE